MEPQKGKQPGCNGGATSCAGLLLLPEGKAPCAEAPGCDAVSFHTGTKECYHKTNPGACAQVALGKMCPHSGWTGGLWQYHMLCPCATVIAPFPPPPASASGPEVLTLSGCGSDWGLGFILTFVIGGALYVVGGVGYAVKAKGAAPGLDALPHREFWEELSALVLDGVSYTKARASGGGRGGALAEKLVAEAAKVRSILHLK